MKNFLQIANNLDVMPSEPAHVPTREQIDRLQAEMAKMPQAELETEHFFANGMYARKVFRKAGTLIVGKVHKQEHFFMLMFGELTVWTEGGMKTIKAGSVIVSKPGTKRVTLAHQDSVGITVHRTELTDPEEIEREIIEDDPGAMFDALNHAKRPALEGEK